MLRNWISLILILASCSSLMAASDYEREMIIMFADSEITMPHGEQSAAINDIIFNNSKLKTLLINHTAERLTIAFPDYDPADSIIESPIFPGVSAIQPRLDRIYRVLFSDPMEREKAKTDLEGYKEIYFADLNGLGEAYFVPNDAEFSRQWNLYCDIHPEADIDAEQAWDFSQGNNLFVIGIIDRAVYRHPEFTGRIYGATPSTADDHGTFAAGIAAAKGNNNSGIAGITWNSEIYSTDTNVGDAVSIYNAVIDAITTGGANILNCSWGTGEMQGLVHMALGIAHNIGVCVVASRGNLGGGPNGRIYPACYEQDWVLSVGASNTLGEKSNFSKWGYGMDVLAPGGQENSSLFDDIYSTLRPNSSFGYQWGTSCAAPHVCGVAGLISRYNQMPNFGSNLRNVIIRTAQHEGYYDDNTGYGIIKAGAALDYISRPRSVYTCESDTHTPYVYHVTNRVGWVFIGVPGLAETPYIAKQYDVREDVEFSDCQQIGHDLQETPIIWGIDCMTNGWSGANPNEGIRTCLVAQENSNGATLRTFVYEIWTVGLNSEYLGFWPNSPSDVDFAYTVIYDETPAPPQHLAVTASVDHHPKITWYPSFHPVNVVLYKVYRKVHGVENNWVFLEAIPHHGEGCQHQYIDTEYSTPHPGNVAQWYDDADYTVTSVNQWNDESALPPFVTITVVVPERPEKPMTKQTLAEELIPDHYELSVPFPNPFNASTTIRYALPEDAFVVIDIINIAGQKVKTILSEQQQAGYKEIIWHASDAASGVYFCKITANNFSGTKQLTLLK